MNNDEQSRQSQNVAQFPPKHELAPFGVICDVIGQALIPAPPLLRPFISAP
jgi:hypothetical protein